MNKNKLYLFFIVLLLMVFTCSFCFVSASSIGPTNKSNSNLIYTDETTGKSWYGVSPTPIKYYYTTLTSGQEQVVVIQDGLNSFDLSYDLNDYGTSSIEFYYSTFSFGFNFSNFGLNYGDDSVLITYESCMVFDSVDYMGDFYIVFDDFYVPSKFLKVNNNGSCFLNFNYHVTSDVDVFYRGIVSYNQDEIVSHNFSFDKSIIIDGDGYSDIPLIPNLTLGELGVNGSLINDATIIKVSNLVVQIVATGDFTPGNDWFIEQKFFSANDFSPTIDYQSEFQNQAFNVNFEVGTFLFDGVSSFLKLEILPGFTLMALFALIVAIPLLIAILKMFLGG